MVDGSRARAGAGVEMGAAGGTGGPGGTRTSCLGMIVRRRAALVEITRRRRGGVVRGVEERRGVSEERGDVFGEPSRGSRWDMLRAGYGEEGGDDCSVEGAAAGCRVMEDECSLGVVGEGFVTCSSRAVVGIGRGLDTVVA